MGASLLSTGVSPKAERISIRRSRFTIPPNTVRWRSIWPRHPCGNLVQSVDGFGRLAIPRPRSRTPKGAQVRARNGSSCDVDVWLVYVASSIFFCGELRGGKSLADELFGSWADEKGAEMWKASGMIHEGCVLAATGSLRQAVEMLTAGNIEYRSTGATLILSWMLSHLAISTANLANWTTLGSASTN